MMKRRIKRALCIMCVVSMALSTNVTAFAYGTSFGYTVKKGEGTKHTGIVKKNDGERKSYVTVKSVMWSTKDPWVFGARIRNSGGSALTGYYTTRRIGAMGNPGLPFLSGVSAYAGQPCRMHMQVDSSSAATLITAKGIWTP